MTLILLSRGVVPRSVPYKIPPLLTLQIFSRKRAFGIWMSCTIPQTLFVLSLEAEDYSPSSPFGGPDRQIERIALEDLRFPCFVMEAEESGLPFSGPLPWVLFFCA